MTKIESQHFWSFGRPDVGRQAKIKGAQVGSRGKVATLCHLLPLLLTKMRGFLCEYPLGSWETRERKEKEKEERERGERRRRKKRKPSGLPLCCREEPQGRPSVLQPFEVVK